ncbi:MAG: hypothetical protein V1907_04405 [Candidatus Kerfeldbacteria bacterium]
MNEKGRCPVCGKSDAPLTEMDRRVVIGVHDDAAVGGTCDGVGELPVQSGDEIPD